MTGVQTCALPIYIQPPYFRLSKLFTFWILFAGVNTLLDMCKWVGYESILNIFFIDFELVHVSNLKPLAWYCNKQIHWSRLRTDIFSSLIIGLDRSVCWKVILIVICWKIVMAVIWILDNIHVYRIVGWPSHVL